MGQYFIAVNHSKKEYVCPWCLGGGAKLWEWCVGPQAGVFPYLLRKSSGTGGGDVEDPSAVQFAGRWAGDQAEVVGDYDDSGGFSKAQTYTNITPLLAKEYNQFIRLQEYEVNEAYCGACKAPAEAKETATA